MPDAVIRLLEAHEGDRLSRAIRAVYGSTYGAAPWLYDAAEVSNRISLGVQISAIAELDGELACHAGLALRSPKDRVGHAGQAVTLPVARGQHLFTATKRFLANESLKRGLLGMYSEATAAHPYSQRANVELGARECGFLLGYIAASVANSVTEMTGRRQSAALFYLRLRRDRARPAYVPIAHREIIRETLAVCQMNARLADAPKRSRLDRRSTLHTLVETTENRAVITVTEPGLDVRQAVAGARDRLFARGYDAVYCDLPLDMPATALLTDPLHEIGLSFAGIFPRAHQGGEVLRLQSVRSRTYSARDIEVASEHGRAVLDYVLQDVQRAGHRADLVLSRPG